MSRKSPIQKANSVEKACRNCLFRFKELKKAGMLTEKVGHMIIQEQAVVNGVSGKHIKRVLEYKF